MRIEREPAGDHGQQVRRGVRGELGEVGQLAVRGHPQRVGRRRGVPRRHPGQRVEGRRGHTEDVGGGNRGPAPGHGRVDVGRRDLTGGLLPQHPRDPEVGEHRAALGGEHDVARGQVAVHHPALVGVRQRGGHRGECGDHLTGSQPTASGEQRGQAAAGQQVEHQGHPRLLAAPGAVHDLVQPDQVRVVELAEQRRLTRLPFGVPGHQQLHGHRRTPRPGHRAPHLAGPAAAQQFLQPVAGDDGRGRGRRHGAHRRPPDRDPADVVHRGWPGPQGRPGRVGRRRAS